jgi:hypothetical protein
MKGYRTPSWFRMKGLLGKRYASPDNMKPRVSKTRKDKKTA